MQFNGRLKRTPLVCPKLPCPFPLPRWEPATWAAVRAPRRAPPHGAQGAGIGGQSPASRESQSHIGKSTTRQDVNFDRADGTAEQRRAVPPAIPPCVAAAAQLCSRSTQRGPYVFSRASSLPFPKCVARSRVVAPGRQRRSVGRKFQTTGIFGES